MIVIVFCFVCIYVIIVYICVYFCFNSNPRISISFQRNMFCHWRSIPYYSTCVAVGTVGVLVVVVVLVLGGKHHACVVAHGVRQIS